MQIQHTIAALNWACAFIKNQDTMRGIIFCKTILFPALILTKLSSEGKIYYSKLTLMSKLFLGIPNESKFRRIFFTTDYWNEVDEHKYTLQAAERKISAQL